MSSRNPFNYPLNPDYGQGAFHRKIRLQPLKDNSGRFIQAELEDCNHGFTLKLYFDQQQVTRILPEAKRIPLTTCAAAGQMLDALIGMNIHSPSRELYAQLDLSSHCTHWLDLAIWAIAHAGRCSASDTWHDRVYHAIIPDELEHGTQATLLLNQEVLLDWQLKDWQVIQPSAYAGQPFYKGFAAWANDIADPQEREAAFMLQKAYFVSRAMLYAIDQLAGEPASKHQMMLGACFSYSQPRVSVAQRTAGSVRDFSDNSAALLKFQ